MADSNKNQLQFAAIKPQYIPKDENTTCGAAKEKQGDEEDGESPEKKAKLENDADGDNFKKHKNRKFKTQRFKGGRERRMIYENLCKTLIDVPVDAPMPVCESLRCKYLHDVKKFLSSKLPDIGEECPVFKVRGHCSRGISCRFGSKHITENGRNIVDEAVKAHYEKNVPKTLTFYTRELENDLRKRIYDFKKSDEILDAIPKVKPLPPVPPFAPYNSTFWGTGEIDFTEDIDVPSQPSPTDTIPPLIEEPVGPCPDDDLFKLHLQEKKKIDWRDKLYLAPIASFGNLPFRRICKEYGVDVTCSEMVVATSILQSHTFEWLLTKRHETEDLFGVQMFGNNPFAMTKCAQLLEEKTNINFIDISVGAPGEMIRKTLYIHKKFERNSKAHMTGDMIIQLLTEMLRSKGMTLMRRERALETIVRCVARVSCLPITVFSRAGDYSDEKIANKFLPNYKACQVSLVTVQGRNRETRQVDWDYVDNLAQKLSPVRVYGVSDVLSYSDYVQIKENYPNVSGAIIGRGALVKPWIFREIKEQRDWDISSSERFEMIRKFVHYGLEHWGSDTKGVELTRRFLLDWLSFLTRYIPVGLLEHPPQKINERAPKFVGRDDMETLLGSQDSNDWVKISEMLLGPCPESTKFIPRIKHNLWPIDS